MYHIFNKALFRAGFLIALFAGTATTIFAQNIIINGDFSSGNVSPWSKITNVTNNTSADVEVLNNELAVTNIQNAEGSRSNLRVRQIFDSNQLSQLEQGKTYRISFDGRSTVSNREIRMVFIRVINGSHSAVTDRVVDLSISNTRYQREFVMPSLQSEMYVAFELGSSNSSVFLDNISFEEVEVVDPNFVENGEFNAGVVEPWQTYMQDDITATFSLSGQVGKFINISQAGTKTHDLQLYQVFNDDKTNRLETGLVYTIKFDAFGAGENRPLRVFFGEDGGDFRDEFFIDLILTNQFQSFTYGFELDQKYENMKLSFEVGTSSESFFVDNVEFFQGGTVTVLPTPPADFALLSPADQQILTESPTQFMWEASSDNVDDPSTLAYQLYLSDDPSFSSLIFTEPVIGDTMISFGQTLSVGEYFWKVDVIDSEGFQVWGSSSDETPLSFSIEEAVDPRLAEFVDPTKIGGSMKAPRVVQATDLDNDGHQDVLVVAEDSVLWAKNDGFGNFGSSILIDSYFGRFSKAATADFDGDSDIDIAVLHTNGSQPIWWLENQINEGNGFAARQLIDQTGSEPETPTDIEAVDLDGDSHIDLVVTYQRRFNGGANEASRVVWYKNDGNGNFGEEIGINGSNQFSNLTLPISVAVADVNHDNMPDVVVGTSWGVIYLYVNQNNATSFSSDYVFNTSSEVGDANDTKLVDIDGDGRLDVLTTNNNGNEVKWFKNQRNNSFGTSQVITTNAGGIFEIDAADYDLDGDIDVASASYWDNKIAWYENDGSGNFSSEFVISTMAEGAISVSSADLNGDKFPDILSASNVGGDYMWYKNVERMTTSNSIDEELPNEFILYQNYPNPFNPTTTIEYSVLEAGIVTIEVWNLLGQKVKTLSNSMHAAGKYSVQLDAGNLNSGVYIYRLTSGGYSMTKKMTLLK